VSAQKKRVTPAYSDKSIVDSLLALTPTLSRRERGASLPSPAGRRAGDEGKNDMLPSFIERILIFAHLLVQSYRFRVERI